MVRAHQVELVRVIMAILAASATFASAGSTETTVETFLGHVNFATIMAGAFPVQLCANACPIGQVGLVTSVQTTFSGQVATGSAMT